MHQSNLSIPLANFILYNLNQAHLTHIAFFHCWNMHQFDTAQNLVNLASNNNIFMQFIKMKNSTNFPDLEYEYLRHNAPTLAIFLDFNCASSLHMLNVSSRERLFNQHYHWIIYDVTADMRKFHNFFANANLSVDTDLNYIQLNATKANMSGMDETQSFVVYDVYNNGYHIGGKLNMTIDREIVCNLDSCAVGKYLSLLHLRSKYGNREQLRDIKMRVATVITKRPLDWPPEQIIEYLEATNETYNDLIPRFGYKVLLLLQDALQFSMLQMFTDRWSTTEAVGGSVGAVATESADITSTPFLATEGRAHYISFLMETGTFLQKCIFRTPRNTNIQGDVFLSPFSRNVWYIFAAMLVLTALILWCTFRLEAYNMHRNLNFVPSLLTTFLISFGAACIQGSHLIPRSSGGRMAFLALIIISFIMYNYYTSIVVSSLLNSPLKSNIKTLGQLADSSLEVGLEPLPFTKSYLNVRMCLCVIYQIAIWCSSYLILQYSRLPEVRRFVKRKIENKHDPSQLWLPPEEGVLRVRDHPGYVYVFEVSAGYAYVEKYYRPHEICDLNEVMLRPEHFIYTGLHRNSSYKEIVRLKQLRMIETGVYRKHRNQWVRNKPQCFANNLIINVGMEYVAPLFFMLLCAYIFVLLILFAEIAAYRYTLAKLP